MIAEDFVVGVAVLAAPQPDAESRSLTVLCDQRPIRDRKAALRHTVVNRGTTKRHQSRRQSAMRIPLSPLRFLERAASVHPDRTAIIDGPRSVTYREMSEQVTRLARAFKARGLRAGDRVAYLAPNCAEELVAHFAVPLAGGVLVTLNTRLSRRRSPTSSSIPAPSSCWATPRCSNPLWRTFPPSPPCARS